MTKLIEVAIPLEAINNASAREKSIRHGHPSSLHLWWARRPLATCRAILFAQLVDDPSSHPDRFPDKEAVEAERFRLFQIIQDLVIWENSTNEQVLEAARAEIRNSCGDVLPSVCDPFSGGGSIPLEAQRLGLAAIGSDLNPVAVLIGKAMIEVPALFRHSKPVHPDGKKSLHHRNAEGLSEDVEFYGTLLRNLAFGQVGKYYPPVNLPDSDGDQTTNVIAWIWARTVASPDPAYADVHVPLISSFALSTKPGKEAHIELEIDKAAKAVKYLIRKGISKKDNGTKASRGSGFFCALSGAAIEAEYVRLEAQAGRMGSELIAIVADGRSGRAYLPPSAEQIKIARSVPESWKPDLRVPTPCHDVDRLPMYGMPTWGDAFTPRQLMTLNTLSNLIPEIRNRVEKDALLLGWAPDTTPLATGGSGARAYSEAIGVYLSFLVCQIANHSTTFCGWNSPNQQMRSTFARQAIPMTWDYAECNIFSDSSGSLNSLFERMVKGFETLGSSSVLGTIGQADAQNVTYSNSTVVTTDPPYYDNIGYADLSDFFYVWLRKNLISTFPDLSGTLAAPKKEELIASPSRHGGRVAAENFFLTGMKNTIHRMAAHSSNEIPAAIFYAFKQSEVREQGTSSTGWATFIEAIVNSGYGVVATWPIRTEKPGRMVAVGTNALANSVVLVCKKRAENAGVITRAEFIRALKRELPAALYQLQKANIAPADMPQASIGPGMGIYSRYEAVLESDDSRMSVKVALELINRELDEFFGGIGGELDPDTRFAVTWFEQNGTSFGEYGVANSIAQARGISVDSVKHAGIVTSAAGKVRLIDRQDLEPNWDPQADRHLTIWECCQHLIRKLETEGEFEAAVLLKKIGPEKADAVKDLAYCLYDVCANKRKDAKEATSYNALIAVWSDLTKLAAGIQSTSSGGQFSMAV